MEEDNRSGTRVVTQIEFATHIEEEAGALAMIPCVRLVIDSVVVGRGFDQLITVVIPTGHLMLLSLLLVMMMCMMVHL